MARGQNLTSKLFNKPLLITMSDLQPIADYLSKPERVASLRMDSVVNNIPLLTDYNSEKSYKEALLNHYDINPETMVGVLNIDGVLVNKEGQLNAQCVELTSYQGLKKRFESQVQQGMKSCVFMINSGGGEAFGAWSTATYIKKIAKESGVKLTTYINGSACSAAYVWAVVADEIISHPMGCAGSIGVLVQLYNDSKKLENDGIVRSFVYAGGNKIPFDKEGNFTEKFITDLQKSVDGTYSKFVNHVVSNSGLTEQDVINTNASVFDADDAIKIGLIDNIMELEDFEITYGLKTLSQDRINKVSDKTTTLSNTNTISYEENMTELEKLQAQLATMQTTLTASETSLTEKTTELSDLLATKESLDTTVADLQKQLTDSQASVTKLTEQLDGIQKDAVTADRKAKLEATLGKDNEQVPQLLASTALLDEQAFSAIVSAMSAKVEKEEKSMTEVGNSANDNTPALTYQDRLKAKAQAR